MTWEDCTALLDALQRDGYTVVAVGDADGDWGIEVTGRRQNPAVLNPGDVTVRWVEA